MGGSVVKAGIKDSLANIQLDTRGLEAGEYDLTLFSREAVEGHDGLILVSRNVKVVIK